MKAWIPKEDKQEFYRLPDRVKAEMFEWIQVIRAILAAKNEAAGIRAQSWEHNGKKGFSKSNIIRKYYVIKKGGNWRCLVNYAKVKRADAYEKIYQRGILIH